MTLTIVLFTVLAIAAEIIGTIGGFGSSLLFVPIAGYFLDFHSVLGITALFHLSSNVSKITLFREGINKRIVLLIGEPSLAFVSLGAYCSKFIDSRFLELGLAVFLIFISVLLLIFKKFVLKPTKLNSIAGGSLSGLAAGLVVTGGALRGLTLAAFNLQKNVFIATSAVIDFGVDFTRTIIYFANGYILKKDFVYVVILIVVGFVGTYIGKIILKRFSEQQFKSGVLVLILIVATSILIKIAAQK